MPDARVKRPGELRWEPVIEGAEAAVVDGDPACVAALYVIRFRTDREIRVPLHWHREDEHITVLAGPFSLAIRGAPGEQDFRQFEPGSYLVMPAGVRHASLFGAGTVVQVSGIGPFESIYVDPSSGLGDRVGKPY